MEVRAVKVPRHGKLEPLKTVKVPRLGTLDLLNTVKVSRPRKLDLLNKHINTGRAWNYVLKGP